MWRALVGTANTVRGCLCSWETGLVLWLTTSWIAISRPCPTTGMELSAWRARLQNSTRCVLVPTQQYPPAHVKTSRGTCCLASPSVLFSAWYKSRGWEKLGVTYGDNRLFSLDVVCIRSTLPRDSDKTNKRQKCGELTTWNSRSHVPSAGWNISGLLDCLVEWACFSELVHLDVLCVRVHAWVFE